MSTSGPTGEGRPRLRPVAGTRSGPEGVHRAGARWHTQDGRPVRPDRDSPAAPEDRHHPDDPEEQMAPSTSRETVIERSRRPGVYVGH